MDEIDPVAGDRVKVSVTAKHPGGRESASGVTSVESNVEVIFGAPEEGEGRVVDVAVSIDEAEIVSQALTVELDDVDVTSRVRVSGPIVADDVRSEENPAVTRYRLEGFVVDFRTMEPVAGQRLRVTALVTTPFGVTSASCVDRVAALPGAKLEGVGEGAVVRPGIADDPVGTARSGT